jgi:hypothetical protein
VTVASPAEPERVAAVSPQPPRHDDAQAARVRARAERAQELARRFLPEDEGDDLLGLVAQGLQTAADSEITLADVSATTERYLVQEALSARYEIPLPGLVVNQEDPLPASIFPTTYLAGGFAVQRNELPK